MDSIESYLKNNLKPKRVVHTYGVRDMAVELAKRYGEDPKRAEKAALYHDMCKYVEGEELDKRVRELKLSRHYLGNSALAHSKLAAALIQEEFGEKDPDIINAVSFHTTGRPNMSMLEKIIYIADAIEPSRKYPGVEELRALAFEDIDEACLVCMKNTRQRIKGAKQHMDRDTDAAIAYFESIKENRRDFMDFENTKAIAELGAKILDEKKAHDIVIIDISPKASFADYFVLASGGSERQIGALADELEDGFAKEGIISGGKEGLKESGWILMDFGDVIVNIFSDEMRSKYSIEKIWGDCEITEYVEGK